MVEVSIIIPVYNAEKYLKKCIESALYQTFKNVEIIVIDDGSTDGSSKILTQYSNKIKIIKKENGGTASALNTGIKAMHGEWFKWLSADDVLYPNAIEELVKETKKNYDKKNTILYTNYDIIDSEDKVVKQFIEPEYNDLSSFDFNVILLDHHIGNGITSLIHRSIFEQYGMFDETIGFAEDYELWLRLCIIYRCRLHLIPKILAKYRIHETQLTQLKSDEALNKIKKIRHVILEKLELDEQEKYKVALKKMKSKKPLSIKIRHTIRDNMIRILPKSIVKGILKIYFKKIKN